MTTACGAPTPATLTVTSHIFSYLLLGNVLFHCFPTLLSPTLSQAHLKRPVIKKNLFFSPLLFQTPHLYPQSTFLDAHHLAVVSYDCNYLLEINSIEVYVCVCLSVYMCTVCVQLPEAARRGHWMLWSGVGGGCESPDVTLLESLSRWREVCMLSGVFLSRGCRARHGGECLYWQHWEGQAVQR